MTMILTIFTILTIVYYILTVMGFIKKSSLFSEREKFPATEVVCSILLTLITYVVYKQGW